MRIDYRKLRPYVEYQLSRMLSRRLLVLRVVVVAMFVVYAGVFWYLQVVRGPEYRRLAEENRLRRRVIRPVRGLLRDVGGELVASNRPAFAVTLDRERCRDPEAEVRRLAALLERDPAPMLERLHRGDRLPRFLPVPLLSGVDLAAAARIEARREDLPAIDVTVVARRHYPLGEAAAHVIGYLSEATEKELRERDDLLPGDRVGRTGVERAWDRELRGKPGWVLEEVNARGRPLGEVTVLQPARHGRAVRLTLEAALQRDLREAFGDRAGAAVFLDPRTGAVRGLYSGPSFDPNLFEGRLTPAAWARLTEDPRRPLHDRVVGSVYSPGSTFKIVMAVAALEEGMLAPGERIRCLGAARFYGRTFHCHRTWGHGEVDLREAIVRSCNIFFYTLGQRLGIERIAAWARRFGLGSRTGIPLLGEAAGIVPDDAWKRRTRGEPWYPGETISVAIGQGPLEVTPLQMAVVAAAIANGGSRVHPHLRVGGEGNVAPVPLGLHPGTIEQVRAAMIDVVESDHGTARRARVPGVVVAGKTGTAQVVSRDAEEDPGDNAWFIGFGPADDPQLAWAILVEHGGHGGEAAAPIASLVLRRWLERHPRGAGEGTGALAKK